MTTTDVVRRNIELAFALVRQSAGDEKFAASLNERSAAGPIAILPADDQELADTNRALAARARERGEVVQEIEIARLVEIR